MSKQNETNKKVEIVGRSKEIESAVRLLYALFKDTKSKSFIRYRFEFGKENFELTFQKFTNQQFE